MSQVVFFERYVHNSDFNNGSIKIRTDSLKFDNCFTFGIQKSKFDSSKHSLALCLTSEQLKVVNHLVEECSRNFKEGSLCINNFKSCLYNNKLYVKIDPKFTTTTYKIEDNDVNLTDVLQQKNYKVDAEVQVKGIFVDSEHVAYLQLRLRKLVVLKKNKLNTIKE